MQMQDADMTRTNTTAAENVHFPPGFRVRKNQQKPTENGMV